jgi:type VI secretion system protein ImpL
LRVPVYAMLTKADLLAGFTEFFDDLDRDSRGQVWGMTFAPSQDEAGLIAGFAAEFKALLTRLNDRLIGRLQTERSPPRRAAIAGFAAQVATLEQPVGEFLQAAFGGSKLDPAPFLRGVYFTSGTQEGTPIDRLTGVLTRSFGIDQRRAPSLRPEQGRSYFLTRLLRDLIFNEAMLVASSPAASRRRTLARAGAFAAIGLLTLAGMGMLWHARSTSQQAIDLAATSLAQYEPVEAAMRLDPVTDSNLPALVPVLDQSRDLPFAGQPVQHAGFDLSQNAKLQAGGDLVYRHVLERVLLPRLIWRLETQMRAGMDRPEFLYEAMRVYLMLGKAGPMDRGFIHAWMALDWQTAYRGALFAPQREGLLHHLDALLAEPLAEVPLDGDLVARARATFGRVSLASRVYSRIRDSSPAQRLPAWRPRDALGAAGSTIFIRASGKPLDDGIAGFYTPAGFHNVLLKALGDMIRNVAAENWVQGERTPFDASGAGLAAVERDVIGLYQADFVRYWDAMVADLSLQETRSLPQAAQDLYILGSNQSPMRGLLASIAQQVTLSVPPGSAVSVQGVIAKPGDDDTQKRLQSLLGTATPAAATPGREIDERYKALRDLVGSGPGAPIDIVLKSLTDLQQQLAKMAAASASAAPAGPDPTLALRAEALRQPQPLARWLTSMANLGTMLRGSAAK